SQARERALAHASTCEVCSSHLARSQALTEALHALSATNRTAETPAAVEENLMRAFRAASEEKPWMRPHSRKRFWRIELAAAAAVLLTVAVVGWHVAHRRGETSPAGVVSAVAHSAKAAPAPISPATQPVADLNHRSVDASRRNSQVLPHRKEALRGFLPLPNADDSDGGTLAMVRIEFQPGALEALGLAAPEGSNSRPITADVLIGDDGMARAIRFDQ
ncbi:MAG: hypothetical protein ACRD2O_06910, partial [Terriglobia bacterium]